MATIMVDVPATLEAFADQRVAAGEFSDFGDYVRQLIRADEANLAWLREEIAAGDVSGYSDRTGSEIVGRALERCSRG